MVCQGYHLVWREGYDTWNSRELLTNSEWEAKVEAYLLINIWL